MELYQFDATYVQRLREGDASVQQHFFGYFGRMLQIKLRARYLTPDVIDDIRQETFARLLVTLGKDDGIQSPERLGAFVNAVCNNVLLEHYRAKGRSVDMEELPEPRDNRIDMDRSLVSEDASRQAREILQQMSPRDRRLLHALFLEEKNKDEICEELGIDRDYLRVLLHRAKAQFREKFAASRFSGKKSMEKIEK